MRKYFLLLDVLSLAAVYLFCFLPRWRACKRCLIEKTALFVYVCALFFVTLEPFVFPIPGFNCRISLHSLHLVPFEGLLHGYSGALTDILLNSIMLLPLGFFLPMMYKKKFWPTVGITLLASVLIELVQSMSTLGVRSCDITDVITNTLGGVLGFALFALIGRVFCAALDRVSVCAGGHERIRIRALDTVVIVLFALQILVRSVLVMYF